MPGYTHMQRAMLSSVGLWASAFAESLLDDLALLKTAYAITDQNPLGSAASYGVNLPIDRQLTTDLLGFAKVQNNVLYTQNARGKFEVAGRAGAGADHARPLEVRAGYAALRDERVQLHAHVRDARNRAAASCRRSATRT